MDPNQVRDLLQTKDLPDDHEIHKKFYRAHTKPYNKAELSLEVLVPKAWVSRPLEVPPEVAAADRDHAVPLLLMGPPGNKDVVLQVSYMRVGPAVALDKVLVAVAKSAGYEVVGRQRGDFNGHPYEEALLSLGGKLIRMTAYRRGELVFLVACSAPQDEFRKWKRDFATSVVSFNPAGGPSR